MSALLFEKSASGRRAARPPPRTVPVSKLIRQDLLRSAPPALPELSELEAVRHFTGLSRKNFSVDTHFYPLGSCTMKYNPKACEAAAALPGFTELHPILPQLRHGGLLTQGALQILYETERLLCELTGMAEFSLQPLAGAHGELTGAMIMAAYHRDRGNRKTKILAPDSAHGTNPASAAIAGFQVVNVPSDSRGLMTPETVRRYADEATAGMMLTNPNTLGLFERHVAEIAQLIHSLDGLMYYDGANFNAIIGRCKPAQMGFDICHLNLHKTFATPHGGGGPGAGPVGVIEKLRPYLPISRVVKTTDGAYALDYNRPKSIGYIAPFYGNFGVIVRAYAYLLMLGKEGLRAVSNHAVLNANYVLAKLRDKFEAMCDGFCMHEFVLSLRRQAKEQAVRAADFAKALIDRGIHPPTIYFPLIVEEAMMIEPTETETKETLDFFIQTMLSLADTAEKDPQALRDAPLTTPVGRIDEAAVARNLDIVYEGNR